MVGASMFGFVGMILIIFDNLSTTVSTPLFPFSDLGKGVIKSMVMWVHLVSGGSRGWRRPAGF